MKYNCKNCAYGPCVYECAKSEGNDYMDETKECPRGVILADWKPMTGEEPGLDAETGLPGWLKVGNFIYMDATNQSVKDNNYRGVSRGIYKITRVSEDSLYIEWEHDRGQGSSKIPLPDSKMIEILKIRPVFPNPYTFETAPVFMKVRKKADGERDILCLFISRKGEADLGSCRTHEKISFEEALRDYEQLDGWPCGTFDEGE